MAVIPGWEPQEDVCIAFDNKTGESRDEAALEAFLTDVREAANRHGFDLNQIGTRAGFARFFHRAFNADGTYRD